MHSARCPPSWNSGYLPPETRLATRTSSPAVDQLRQPQADSREEVQQDQSDDLDPQDRHEDDDDLRPFERPAEDEDDELREDHELHRRHVERQHPLLDDLLPA